MRVRERKKQREEKHKFLFFFENSIRSKTNSFNESFLSRALVVTMVPKLLSKPIRIQKLKCIQFYLLKAERPTGCCGNYLSIMVPFIVCCSDTLAALDDTIWSIVPIVRLLDC